MEFRFTKRTAFLVVWDIAATFLSYWLGSVLTFQDKFLIANHEICFILGIAVVINLLTYVAFRLYNNLWEYASTDDMLRIVVAVGLGILVSAVFLWTIGEWVPIRVYCVALILQVIFIGGIRMQYRVMRSKKREFAAPPKGFDRPRTLVVGAGETGSLAINRMVSNDPNMLGDPIVAVDDDPAKQRQRIHGVRVLGTSEDIPDLVSRFDIEQIVVAIPSATLDERKRIYSICTETNCQLRTLPNVRELTIDEIDDIQLREVDVADLLGREEIVLNTRMVCGYISGKTVLVTGGAGSIGSELCRQMATVAPERIVIFDMWENDAYLLKNEIMRQYDDIEVCVEIGSVCDVSRLRDVFVKYEPDAVFHAAAHKHVPLMEL